MQGKIFLSFSYKEEAAQFKRSTMAYGYGYIYVDTFKGDREISTKRCLRGALPLFKWFLNRQWMCKRGVGSVADSRNINGFATQ